MLDKRTTDNLKWVDPSLVHLCFVMDQEGHKFIVPDPPRTKDEQGALYAQGRESLAEVNKKRSAVGWGKIAAADNRSPVTWTLFSKHNIQNDGWAHAFDFVNNPVDYSDIAAFDRLGVAFEECAKKLGIKILWGGRGLGKSKQIDRPHIELLT